MRISLGPRPPKRPFDERPIFAIAFLGMFVAALWFPFHRNPYMCSFKQITGYPCFSCGMTRSWIDQINGRIWDGIVQSPFGSLLCWLALAFTVWTVARVVLRLPSLKFQFKGWESVTLWTLAVVFLFANWIYTIMAGVA
jgi:hypothetical protein